MMVAFMRYSAFPKEGLFLLLFNEYNTCFVVPDKASLLANLLLAPLSY